MNAGIEDALAEATAAPAPEGTLEFQAEAMAVPEAGTALAAAETADASVEQVLAETSVSVEGEVAVAEANLVPVEPGTLQAQAVALKSGAALPESQIAALPESNALPAPEPDQLLVGMKPKARPDEVAGTDVAAAKTSAETLPPVEDALIAEVPPELVVTDPGTEIAQAEDPLPLLRDVTEVETVAAAATVTPPDIELAVATVAAPLPKRQAPIFDAVSEEEEADPIEDGQEVVVVMSTAGGRHFGVNVGEFPSRYEAEKALLKTALAESATLNEGLRKTTQSGGAWRASFMGLTEEQAELACRRLSARAIPCETVGG
jgi:D-alanyl-D-alanine carboxypeptidase